MFICESGVDGNIAIYIFLLIAKTMQNDMLFTTFDRLNGIGEISWFLKTVFLQDGNSLLNRVGRRVTLSFPCWERARQEGEPLFKELIHDSILPTNILQLNLYYHQLELMNAACCWVINQGANQVALVTLYGEVSKFSTWFSFII